jgi:hypothetical protein
VLHRHGEHRGRRRLAVGAGDRDAAPTGHQRREGLGPQQHPQAALAGGDQLRVRLADRRGHHHGVDVVDVGGLVAEVDGRAERTQRGGGAGVLGVAARHGRAAGEQDPRDAAHAGAADADQVDASELLAHRPLTASWTSATSATSASR